MNLLQLQLPISPNDSAAEKEAKEHLNKLTAELNWFWTHGVAVELQSKGNKQTLVFKKLP